MTSRLLRGRRLPRLRRVSVGWGVIGEFDGRSKYLFDALRGDRRADDVVVDEKEREDRLRALPTTSGFVRWGRRHVAEPHLLAGKLRTAGVPLRRP